MRPDEPSAADPPDSELISRWMSGDERAAALLVARHAEPLGRYVGSLGLRGEVQEVVQDTFVRAFGSLESFRGESSLRTWLFTIARRLVLDARRADRRNPEVGEVLEGQAFTSHDALDELVAEESRQRIQQALGRLSPTQREVFVLRVNDGLSYREIAEIVGTTEGAARVHYHHALRQVKERLHA